MAAAPRAAPASIDNATVNRVFMTFLHRPLNYASGAPAHDTAHRWLTPAKRNVGLLKYDARRRHVSCPLSDTETSALPFRGQLLSKTTPVAVLEEEKNSDAIPAMMPSRVPAPCSLSPRCSARNSRATQIIEGPLRVGILRRF